LDIPSDFMIVAKFMPQSGKWLVLEDRPEEGTQMMELTGGKKRRKAGDATKSGGEKPAPKPKKVALRDGGTPRESARVLE
jgi:hypothetical protein